MTVEIIRPSMPYCSTIPKTITIKAPVGPPICTLLPPSKEIRKPATIAVIKPFSGETPEATAKAMARGRATIPTTIPANMSDIICSLEIPAFNKLKNFGINMSFICLYSCICNILSIVKKGKNLSKRILIYEIITLFLPLPLASYKALSTRFRTLSKVSFCFNDVSPKLHVTL